MCGQDTWARPRVAVLDPIQKEKLSCGQFMAVVRIRLKVWWKSIPLAKGTNGMRAPACRLRRTQENAPERKSEAERIKPRHNRVSQVRPFLPPDFYLLFHATLSLVQVWPWRGRDLLIRLGKEETNRYSGKNDKWKEKIISSSFPVHMLLSVTSSSSEWMSSLTFNSQRGSDILHVELHLKNTKNFLFLESEKNYMSVRVSCRIRTSPIKYIFGGQRESK